MPTLRTGSILLLISATACSGNSTPTSPSSGSTSGAATISSVTVSANPAVLNKKGATTQAVATATFSNATTREVTSSCGYWQSDNQGVATVSGEGVLTAQSSGSATISAMCQGVPARGGVTLSVLLKATPTLITSASINNSPEPPFLFRARFQYSFGEAGGAYGVNVNFLNTQILNAAGDACAANVLKLEERSLGGCRCARAGTHGGDQCRSVPALRRLRRPAAAAARQRPSGKRDRDGRVF